MSNDVFLNGDLIGVKPNINIKNFPELDYDSVYEVVEVFVAMNGLGIYLGLTISHNGKTCGDYRASMFRKFKNRSANFSLEIETE